MPTVQRDRSERRDGPPEAAAGPFRSVLRGAGSPLEGALGRARRLAAFDVPVLLNGEPGTGKARIARAMHDASRRAAGPYLEVQCAGRCDDMLEAELTGPDGLFAAASGGTLFLDGVDGLSPRMQRVLLLAAREGLTWENGAQAVDLRLVTGAARDLKALVEDGAWCANLFYALAVVEIEVPSLRARRGDIGLIAQAMLIEQAERLGKTAFGLTEEAVGFLEAYDWPGNLPELRNELTRMLVFAEGRVLGAELLSRHILQAVPGGRGGGEADALALEGTLKEKVELVEMRILRETLTRLKWNKSRAAAELGLSRVGLRAKLDRYGIERGGAALAEPR